MNNYKIYYHNSFVLIHSDVSQSNKNFDKVISNAEEIKAFVHNPSVFFDGVTNNKILIQSANPETVLKGFMQSLELVLAGGGIVWNENDELLMIYRRGHWDLPKGKIEKKEKIIDGAVREVTEETGVLIATVSEPAVHTYHAYVLKGKNCLKQTSWYQMHAKPGQSNLTPQTEEDIEEVKWVKRSEIKNYEAGCYPLIRDLILPFKN